MKLSTAQRAEFEEQGYLFLPSLFSPAEMDVLNAEVPGLFAQQRAEVVREKGSDAVASDRFAARSHGESDACGAICGGDWSSGDHAGLALWAHEP